MMVPDPTKTTTNKSNVSSASSTDNNTNNNKTDFAGDGRSCYTKLSASATLDLEESKKRTNNNNNHKEVLLYDPDESTSRSATGSTTFLADYEIDLSGGDTNPAAANTSGGSLFGADNSISSLTGIGGGNDGSCYDNGGRAASVATLSNDGSTHNHGHHPKEYEDYLVGYNDECDGTRYNDDRNDDDDNFSVGSSGEIHFSKAEHHISKAEDDYDDEYDDDDDDDDIEKAPTSSKSLTSKTSATSTNTKIDGVFSDDDDHTNQIDKLKRNVFLLLVCAICITTVLLIVQLISLSQQGEQEEAADDDDDDDNDISMIHDVPQIVLSFLQLGLLGFLIMVHNRYHNVVEERHDKLLHIAERTSAVVSSLFPKAVQTRIMADVEEKNAALQKHSNSKFAAELDRKVKDKLNEHGGGDDQDQQQHSSSHNWEDSTSNLSILSKTSNKVSTPNNTTRKSFHNLGMSSFSNLATPQLKRKLLGGGKTHFSPTSSPTSRTRRTSPGGNTYKERAVMSEFLEESDFVDQHSNAFQYQTTSRPIADLFPEATIIFADLVGFTAWSSMREPSQVFTLLESIYNEFDKIARRRKVFKVETVGDCYVAVCGLPEPNARHAIAVARFASECRQSMNDLVKDLEVTLGPDTADLRIRVGIHSGPVTAGVLRGDKARFQLFGDTVNTTSRIETTGKPDKIHVSQETAQYLIAAGKEHWLTLREEKVSAKGKGELTTYWLKITSGGASGGRRPSMAMSTTSETTSDMSIDLEVDNPPLVRGLSEKQERLVHWITNELAVLLKEVEVGRIGTGAVGADTVGKLSFPPASIRRLENDTFIHEGRVPLDEVEEIITLPSFDKSSNKSFDEMNMVRQSFELPEQVLSELHLYVRALACMYHNNPFHSFEHASHVTMSVVKLLSRIVAPDINYDDEDAASKLHEYTFGITSDPMTQFAVVLSALIHDLDHPGVPNGQLVKESDRMARKYDNKSVAEQNSVDMAWRLLMDEDFKHLRGAIYHTETEFKRFRKLVVNTVLATDIMDKNLGAARKERWAKAFSDDVNEDDSTAINRKATIVLEHLIQASDVAHTMQHWHIYRKWNSRLFAEMYRAFLEGRANTDPSLNWYAGELSFFDFYIIPLAHKLKDCGVFGVSSDEYLNYAEQNRREWELNGKRVVSEMVAESAKLKHTEDSSKPTMTRSVMQRRSSTSLINLKDMANEIGQQGTTRLGTESRIFKRKSQQQESAPLTELPDLMNILVVDDDKITRKMFTRSVKKVAPKWHVQDAESGEKALELLFETDTKFDLIFMDHYMGTSSDQLLGSATVIELRKRGIECVVCGMSANDVENLFESAGADEFIFKPLPFRDEALKRELLRILSTGDGWGF